MRMGHSGEKSLQNMVKHDLMKGPKTCKLELCKHCVLGKQSKVMFGTAIYNTKGILDCVLSDVCGPTRTTSLGGMHYFVTFVDDFLRRVWVYMMKTKDEVLDRFLKWKNMAENQTGRMIKRRQTNNGIEYAIDTLVKVYQDDGIIQHFTVRRNPLQNGVAEHMNRILLEKVSCMLSNAGSGKAFWAEVVMYVSHLINRLPSTA